MHEIDPKLNCKALEAGNICINNSWRINHARFHSDRFAENGGVSFGNFAADSDIAKAKLLTLLHVESDQVSVTLTGQSNINVLNLKINKAARLIKVSQSTTIKSDAIFNKRIASNDRPQNTCLLGLKDTAQTAFRISAIADKSDIFDLCHAAFDDFKHQINTVVGPWNKAWAHSCADTALCRVILGNGRRIEFGLRRTIGTTRLRADQSHQLRVFNLGVTFNIDNIDRRQLDNCNHKGATVCGHVNSLEQSRRANPLGRVV